MKADQALNGWDGAGLCQQLLEGTDLELVHNLQGDDLVLRVNKAGVLVFRALLREAVPPLLETRLTEMRENGAPTLREQWGEQAAAIGMTVEEIIEGAKGRRGRGRARIGENE